MYFRSRFKHARAAIAIQNSFPRQSHTAENEFIRRLQLCAERLAIETHVVDWSTEVAATGADFLLSLHEVSPKLTPTLTIGAMWNPPSGIRRDPVRCDFAASFDAYLSASASVTRFIADITARFSGPPKPVADFRFFPTSPSGIAQATSYDSLAYLGVHWDGARHGDFLDRLIRENLLSVYGPQSAWSHAGSAYRGGIPFDGTSVIRRLAEHGIVLCLHRDPHIAEDTPSMRLFEAASAGCLILCDAIPFARDMFGDSIFVLPDGDGRVEYVREKLAWAKANPKLARRMARESKTIFDERFSLDKLLPKVVEFARTNVKQISRRKLPPLLLRKSEQIDIFYDYETVNQNELDEVISLLNSQTHYLIKLIIIQKEGADSLKKTHIKPRSGIIVRTILRCNKQELTMSYLMTETHAQFFTKLHRNVVWATSHLGSLLHTLKTSDRATLALSSTVVSFTNGARVTAPNFAGDADNSGFETSLFIRDHSDLIDNPITTLQVKDLLARSDWLMRMPRASGHADPTDLDLSNAQYATAKTGYVSCFCKIDTTEKPDPIVFC